MGRGTSAWMNINWFLFAAAVLAQGGKTLPGSPEDKTRPSDSTSSSRRPRGMAGVRCRNPVPRQRVVYHLGEDKRQCPKCQEKLKRIGEEVSERLE